MQNCQEAILLCEAHHLAGVVDEDEVEEFDQLLDRVDIIGMTQLELDH